MSHTHAGSFDATYRRHLAEGNLAYQRCGQGHAVFPPRAPVPPAGQAP